ncbi:Tetratricopeptide TPR_2 repeat protein [metagenome]|uniref:Tetratricopeptide TPR_2 repeat protein n=1 Tax=metagenome TaxID=256318 RepID=A0A2P2BZ80_9ZZZZ
MQSAEELHRRGVVALTARRFDAARKLLLRAREAADTPQVQARVEASLAFHAYETGDADEAFRLCRQALELDGLDPETHGIVQCQHALLLLRNGKTTESLRAFADAIRSLEDPLELAKAHINRGGVFLQFSDAGKAIRDFELAALHAREAGDALEESMALHNLGYALMLKGDLVSALEMMDRASPTLSAMSPLMKATVDQDRAEVLIAAGLVREGQAALRDAARVFGLRRSHQRRGEAELTLARTLQHSHPAAALGAAREARRRFVRTGTDAWRIRADSAALAAEVELGRHGDSLLVRGDALALELDGHGLYWGAASVKLHTARVMLRRGDVEEARERIRTVRLLTAAPLSLRLLARDVRAELASLQGRRSGALAQVRCGLAELHAWQSSFGSLDLQTMVVGHGTSLARRGLSLAVDSGRAAVLYEWSERARMLASRIQPVRAPTDEQMASDLAELRRLATPQDGARVPYPRRAEEIRTRVRERAWQLRGSGEVAEPTRLSEVRAQLGPDTALVAWVVTHDRVTALVVDAGAATRHDLGPRADLEELLDGLLPDLDVAASTLPEALARVVREQLASRLEDLGTLLIAPLLPRIGDRRVVLTPSGVLAGVPWTLLPGFVGRPVTVAQSATSWLARRTPLSLRTAGFVAGPRVARAEAEVHDAARRWSGSVELRGDLATADAVAELAARVDVLHIAAHGRHSADNPLFSGVELVGGPWFGYDIDQLESVPQVVLLSACEVGRSSVRYGEELIGMTAAWLHAGVRCVIASSVAVSDEAAHDVLTEMHTGLAGGLDPATALAAAVPSVSAERPPAPFVCFA